MKDFLGFTNVGGERFIFCTWGLNQEKLSILKHRKISLSSQDKARAVRLYKQN